ncbi:IPT/TIG domain-containing protein [Cellulomonas sp. NPDC058312]|uniref:IPT/TIG domain-containing protein n=1 Tax=Cellulomonas sp. NPDC058312 TaxID=3346441 RepID=UPI0036ED550C
MNVLNAFVGTPPIDGGVFYRAQIGTPGPSDALDELHANFKDHGAVGEDGVTVAQTRDNTDVKMYGGKTFVTVQTNYDEQITITLLEDDNEAVLKTAFGDANVEVTPATVSHGKQKTIYHTADPLPISSFVIDSQSGKKLKRYYVENGQVVNVAEIKDVHTNVTSRTLTIKTYSPTSVELKGGNVVEFRDDGALPAVASLVTFAPTSVAPAGGDLVHVEGSGFVGTTGITVGGTAAPEFSVIDDSTLVFAVPAKAAGTYPVIVTNATGPSASKTLTYA